MRKSIIGLAAVAALFALPNIASATDSGAAAGAVTGGVAGAAARFAEFRAAARAAYDGDR